jgi:hypothetical protein
LTAIGNGEILEATTEEDLVDPQSASRRPRSFRKRWTLALLPLAAVGAILLAATLAGAAGRSPERSALTFRTSHYLCYDAKTPDTFNRRGVLTLDQFKQRRKTVVTGPEALCNPASKNGSRIVDKRAHLVCYRATSSQTFRTRRVVVKNQFGTTRLVVVKPTSLCLPSAKSLEPTTEKLPIPRTIGHFQCYPVKPVGSIRPRRVTVTDQFGDGRYAVTIPVRLCNPARKNASPIVNARDHLVCYAVDPLQRSRARDVVAFNQFGAQRLTAFAAVRLCLPSLKTEIMPQPDLTVTLGTPSVAVSCPTGGGSCITTVNFTVTNTSATPVTASFAVLIQTDPAQSKTITVGGIGAGVSLSFSEPVGPDGNCFDPDCTITVTVDSGNVVAESNESNNVATATSIG